SIPRLPVSTPTIILAAVRKIAAMIDDKATFFFSHSSKWFILFLFIYFVNYSIILIDVTIFSDIIFIFFIISLFLLF
ncbi:MAG: hypothetical protein WCY38_06555, partial [Endomicrobiia bacterium]